MKYIHNLQKTCVVKVKATGIPHYSALKKNNILIIESKKDLFTQYESCKRSSSLVRHSEK
tara:strand:+ start:348 stop:527 length:180 start_codon:yes stop_codon:yes gene_type:complete